MQARNKRDGTSAPIWGPHDESNRGRHPGLRQLADFSHLLFPGISWDIYILHEVDMLICIMLIPDVHCSGADRGSSRLGAVTSLVVVLRARLSVTTSIIT